MRIPIAVCVLAGAVAVVAAGETRRPCPALATEARAVRSITKDLAALQDQHNVLKAESARIMSSILVRLDLPQGTQIDYDPSATAEAPDGVFYVSSAR